LTKTAAPSSLSIRPWVDADLLEWVEQRTRPGGPFATVGHAAELALGRLQDELDRLAKRCKAEGVRFEWAAVRRAYADALGTFQPVAMGRPRRGAAHVERRRTVMFIDRSLLEWVEQRAANGLFHEDDPVAHAIDAGLRNLRAAEDADAIRSAAFPFDLDALWMRYRAR
jgi:hypothetical protein